MCDLVSIVVPVYNVRQYLDKCVNSLINQTHPNLEILLIDDGSTDGSGALCDLWQQRDSRIRVFHKPNGGLSDARNHGLERATGAYICFIDSDDWCDLRFVEELLRALVDTGADLAECDYVCTDGTTPATDNAPVRDYRVYTGRDCFYRFLTGDFFVSVCTKLYRRSLLENEPFRKGVYHEDEFWTYRIFAKARKVCRLSFTGYCYYQRQDSIVHTTPSVKRLTDAFDAAKERMAFLESHYPEYGSLGCIRMMDTLMHLYHLSLGSSEAQYLALQKELLSTFRRVFRTCLRKGQFRNLKRHFCCFRLFPKLYLKQFD